MFWSDLGFSGKRLVERLILRCKMIHFICLSAALIRHIFHHAVPPLQIKQDEFRKITCEVLVVNEVSDSLFKVMHALCSLLFYGIGFQMENISF